MASDDLIREAKERFEAAEKAEHENVAEALEDLKFYAGRQWDEAIRLDRQRQHRPVLTINRIPQFVRQVTGDIRLNPPAIKVRPAGGKASADLAETFTGLIRNIESQSDADAAYITAAESAARCGQGFFRVTTEYSDDDGWNLDIRIRRILSPFAVLFDPAAQDAVRSDAEWCFVQTWVPKLTFKERYPKANTDGWDGPGLWTGWTRKDDVRIVEYWRKVPYTRRLMLLNDGQTIDATGKKDAELLEVVQKGGGLLRERSAPSHKVRMHLMNAMEELEDPADWAGKYIPIIPVYGEEVHVGEEVVRSGIVRGARDPQRLFNIHRSALAEGVAMAPKAKWLGTAKNFAGNEALWGSANTNNSAYLIYTPDQGNPAGPQRIAPDMPGQGLLQEIGLASQDMEATTGIYRDMMGKESNAQSGKAILARQREGDTGTFTYSDNTARAVAHCGRILVDLIPKIYDTERQVRVLGEDGSEKFVPVNQTVIDPVTGEEQIFNDLSAGKYDVVASVGPSYGTRREEAAEGLMAFMGAVPAAAPMIADLVASNSNWPGNEAIAKRLRKALPPGVAEPEEGDPPPQPPAPGADVLLAQAEMMKAQAAMAKVQAETERAKAEMQLEMMKLQIEAQRLQIEQAEVGITARDKQATVQIKGFQAQTQARTAAGKLRLDGAKVAVDMASKAADQRHRRGATMLDSAHKHADREADRMQWEHQQRMAMQQMARQDRQQDQRTDAD